MRDLFAGSLVEDPVHHTSRRHVRLANARAGQALSPRATSRMQRPSLRGHVRPLLGVVSSVLGGAIVVTNWVGAG
jgi:hypothetical protein